MGRNSPPTNAIVIDGDITRKIASVYVPDYYKENPVYETSLALLKNSAYELEYVFGMIQKMPELVDVDKCPDHLLPLLASLLGYKWDPNLSVHFQRREIAKLVQVYLIKGSPRSVIRLVYYAGASIADVMTPSDYLFQLNKSQLSGGDHFEDPLFWRWGTYEVVADIDFSGLNDRINAVHPAGTIWYGRQLIQLLATNTGKIAGDGYGGWTEIEVIHTATSNYPQRNASLYKDLVLNGDAPPIIYYKLDEPKDVPITREGFYSDYGDAEYGEGQYGVAASLGKIAYNSVSRLFDGRYNLESEVLFYTNSVDKAYDPKIPLSASPVNPGTITVDVGGEIVMTDDGKSRLSSADKLSTARIDYDTGILYDFRFNEPPGSWPSKDIPRLQNLDTTNIPSDNLLLWLKSDVGVSYDEDDLKVDSWTDQSDNGLVFSNRVTEQQPTLLEASTEELPALSFDGTSVLATDSPLDLGSEHTVFIVFKPATSPDSDSVLISGQSSTSSINVGIDSEVGFNCVGYHSGSSTFAINHKINEGRWQILTVKRSSGNPEIYIDGVKIPEKWDTSYTSTGDFALDVLGAADSDGSSGFSGSIGEIIAYSVELGTDDQRVVETYLANKYLMASGQVVWYAASDLGTDSFFWKDRSNLNRPAVQVISTNCPKVRPYSTFVGPEKLALLTGTTVGPGDAANYFWLRPASMLRAAAIHRVGSTKEYRYTFNSSSDAIEAEFSSIGDGEDGTAPASDLILRKNGEVYGTPHSSIEDIQTIGEGLYRHVGSQLSFSLPDGEDNNDSVYSVERPMPDLGTSHTISFVFSFKRLNTNGAKIHSFLSSYGTEKCWIYYNPTDNILGYQVTDLDFWELDLSSAPLEAHKLYCLTIVRNETKTVFFLNGIRISGQSLPEITLNASTTFSRFGVEPNDGATDSRQHPFNGYLAEMVIYDRALSTVERYELDKYLQTKWGILNVPVTVFYNDYVERGVPSILPSADPKQTGVVLGNRPRNNKGCVRLVLGDDNTTVRPVDESYGIEAWFNTGNPGCIFDMEWLQDDELCCLAVNVNQNGNIEFKSKLGAYKTVNVSSPITVSDKNWHHLFVGMYRDENLVRIYIDGNVSLRADVDFMDFSFLPDKEILFGAALAPTTGSPLRNFLSGGLDEVAIYKENLPDEDSLRLHYLHGNDNLAVIKSTVKYILTYTESTGAVSQSGFTLGNSRLGSEDVLGESRLAASCTDNQSSWEKTIVNP